METEKEKTAFWDDLDKVSEGTEKPVVAEGTVGKLIDICDEAVRKCKMEYIFTDDYKTIIPIKKDIFNDLEKSNIKYNESDISNFCMSLYNRYNDDWQKQIAGLFSGCLVDSLYEQNQMENKRTNIHVFGAHTDYLLYFARNADEIIVENCTGDNILTSAGQYGKIDYILINNCKGNFIGDGIGGYEGVVNTAVINNIEGHYVGWRAGIGKGKLNNMILTNVLGDIAGDAIASSGGRINNLIIRDITGNGTISRLADESGKIGLLFIEDFTGKRMGDFICRGTFQKGERDHGVINKMVKKNINCPYQNNDGSLGEAVKSWPKYEKIIKSYSLEEIFSIVNSLESSSHKRMSEGLREISRLLAKGGKDDGRL